VSDANARIRAVEGQSAGFRKELGLPTLVLTQVMFIVGSGWVGTAAKLGDGHVVFWLTAMALFYLPQAAVVIYLNRLMPLEGGLYQWATVGFGQFGGFLTAWNLWAFAILILATFGVMIATNLAYLVGTSAEWLTGAEWYTPVVSSTAIVFITFFALYGLRVGKWMQAVGGAAQLLTYTALLLVPLLALSQGKISEYHPFAASIPPLTALNLNLLGKMALGALSGFEYVALLAGECRNPARTIGRSVVIASPIIALMFILGTSTVAAMVPKDQIDLVSPIPQTLKIAFSGMGFASIIAPLLIAALAAPNRECVAHVRGYNATANGRRVGRTLAEMVRHASPASSHAGQLDLVRGWPHARSHARGSDRGRVAGSVSGARERRRDFLCVRLHRHVLDSTVCRRTAAGETTALAVRGRGRWTRDVCSLFGAVDLSDHRGTRLARVHGKDRGGARRHERAGSGHLRRRNASSAPPLHSDRNGS